MAGIYLDKGVLYGANALFDKLADVPLFLALFQQDINPAVTDTDATYIGAGVEADFPGYARILLDSWTVSGPTAHVCSIIEILRVFVSTGTSSNFIYGYFLVTAGDDVIGAERDPAAPVDMTANGAVYAVLPKLKDLNC